MNKAKLGFIFSMLLVGSVGLFVRQIPLSSAHIALFRGSVGGLFILICSIIFLKKIDFKGMYKNLPVLLASGMALGFNWMLLFEAYKYTTIATATICYYFAPVLILIVSPFLLKERLTVVKIISILASMAGIVCVMGIGDVGSENFLGIICGLSAAMFYATVVILNKKLKNISGIDAGIVQLFVSAVVMFFYLLVTDTVTFDALSPKALIMLIIVGVLHTGVFYLLYFTFIQKLPAHTVAIFSYIDPVFAIIFSALFLMERITVLQFIGGLLVLGAAFFNEMYSLKKEQLPK